MTSTRGFRHLSYLRYLAILLAVVVLYLLWAIGNVHLITTDTYCKCPESGQDQIPKNDSREASHSYLPSAQPVNHSRGGQSPESESPVEDWRHGTDEIVGQLSELDAIEFPVPKVRVVLANECLKKLNLSTGDKSFHLYRETRIHIIYSIWLPAGQPHSHLIAEPQLYETFASGLFTRPNTFVHVIVSTNSSTELNWLKSLDLWRHVPHHEFIHNYWNMYEFPAMRAMWEMACKDPDAIFLYFHNKGTRYRHNRRFYQELILTRQIVLPWKSMLTLLMSQPKVPHIGFGGYGWQWMNFFWIRGSYMRDTPIPIRSDNRFYYEYFIARRAKPNQCHLAKGFAASLNESPEPTPKQATVSASFSIDTCATGSVNAKQVLQSVFDNSTRLLELTEP